MYYFTQNLSMNAILSNLYTKIELNIEHTITTAKCRCGFCKDSCNASGIISNIS